jgi:hypothetical protein
LISRYFNPAAFALQPEGQFGNVGRNSMRGPGSLSMDIGLFKQFFVHEGHRLQYRAEFYSVTNHPVFGLPNANLQSPQFGQINGAGGNRVIQMALRYQF